MPMTSKEKNLVPRSIKKILIRFADEADLNLVRDAAAASRLSINGWLVQVTVAAAQQQLDRIAS